MNGFGVSGIIPKVRIPNIACPCARHCSKYCTCISSFISTKEGLLVSSLCRRGTEARKDGIICPTFHNRVEI